MNRIEERLAALKEEGKKAFITYTTAGLPDYDTTKKLMFAQEKARYKPESSSLHSRAQRVPYLSCPL